MRKSALPAALGLCLFFIVLGAKWAVFDRYGSAMPDWDQWDAEGSELLVPWFENESDFLAHLFSPHNEHRVVLTKLQSLALVLLNGQWDSRLEAVTNAFLHSLLAVAFWAAGRRCMAARWHAPLFVLIAALFALPFAWQNVLGGFHSQQYWLVVLSFAAIVTVPFARRWSAQWWLGVAAAVLALGSMGSGLLAAAVVIVIVTWRLIRGEISFRQAWPTLGIMLALVVFGWVTREEVAGHAQFKARTLHDYFFSIVHSLQWPWRNADWAAAVLWIPWLAVVWRLLPARLTRRPAGTLATGEHSDNDAIVRAGLMIAAIGGWTVAQAIATAYARGAGADYPASRYMDTLAVGVLANGLALGWLLSFALRYRVARAAGYGVALAWLVTLAVALRTVTHIAFRFELPDAKKYYVNTEGNMRRFLATNDPKQLVDPYVPYPSVDGLVERLANPSLRRLMPVPIRPPLPMAADEKASPGFLENNAVRGDWEDPPVRGLSPAMSPLDHATTWGSFAPSQAAPARWRSMPLTAPLGGWLKFETAGDVPASSPDLKLTLHDARTGERLADIAPSRRPGDSWRAAYVRAPREPFVVMATDASEREWLAFSQPVEMGRYSYWAWQATRQGRLILYCAAGAALLLALLELSAARVAGWIRRGSAP